jgi:pimeloyl-ACP methyl ester carboxylesterase
VPLGCLLRVVGAFFLLLFLLVAARRLTERPAAIPLPGPGERDTVVDGVRWRSREAEDAGRGGTDVSVSVSVVFVHGFLSSSSTWNRALAAASAGRPAIAVDLPGAGFSDRPWPYDYTAYAQASHLLRYLEVRGIRRVVLVGNSLGGAVCEVAAAARPELVAGLVLVDAAGPATHIPWGFRMLRTPVVGEVQIELAVRPAIAYALRERLYARAERVSEETIDDWWRPVTVPGTRRAAIHAIRTSRRGADEILARITAPTLVVWGADDALMPATDGLALASSIHGARFLTIPDAGHLPQEEVPEAFARAVASFVSEVDGPEAGAPR